MKLFKSQQEIANELHETVLKSHSISELQTPLNVIWWNKTIIYPLLGIGVIFLFFVGNRLVLASKIKCSDYKTQLEAQNAFESNPNYFYMLDRNHNGVACEHLPKFIEVK